MVFVIFILLGLCFGSFVNALVWRMHEQGQTKNKKDLRRLSVTRGRSMCVNCKHELGLWDLIPVFSWLWLRGRCRYCQKPISWQYPAVELITAGLFVFSYVFWPSSLDGAEWLLFSIWLILLVGLIALLVYDIRWMLLPNKIVFPLMFITAAGVVAEAIFLDGGWGVIREAILGVVFGGGLFYLLYQVSGGRWIGGGDVKLGFLLGIIVGGPINALMLIFIASLLGSIVGILLITKKKFKTSHRIPFGPFLIIAAIIVQLFGSSLLEWYKATFLFV